MALTIVENQGGSAQRSESLEVDLQALYSEFGKIVDDTGEGLSMAEVRQQLGCGEKRSREFIRAMIDKGMCRPERRRKVYIDGRVGTVPVYVFVNGEK